MKKAQVSDLGFMVELRVELRRFEPLTFSL
jgi:hypothetical protein